MIGEFLTVYSPSLYSPEQRVHIEGTFPTSVNGATLSAVNNYLKTPGAQVHEMAQALRADGNPPFLFVSDHKIASKTEAKLAAAFGTPQNLTALLRKEGYTI